MFLCFKLETIVSSALIHSTLLSSWLLSQVWNIKTHNLFIFQQRKSPEFWTTKWSKEGTWFHSFEHSRRHKLHNVHFKGMSDLDCLSRWKLALWRHTYVYVGDIGLPRNAYNMPVPTTNPYVNLVENQIYVLISNNEP